MPEVTIPGVGVVDFPDSMPLEAIQAQAQRLSGRVGRDSRGQINPDLALLDRQMSDTQPGVPASQFPTSVRIPGLNTDISLSGAPKTAFDAVSGYLDRTMTPAVVGATIGSMAFPPGAAGLGLLARFAPPVLASAAGGGIGGAADEAHRPGSTPASIATQGLESAAQMGGAEIGSLGIGALANKLLAPGLPLDPFAEQRPKLGEFARQVGGQVRDIGSKLYGALPEGAQGALDSAIASQPAQYAGKVAGALGKASESIPGSWAKDSWLIPAALNATFGLHVGVPAAIAREIIYPGNIARYLASKQTSPYLSAGVSALARQTASIPLRSFFDDSNKDEKKDEP